MGGRKKPQTGGDQAKARYLIWPVAFAPKKDITTYELSILIPYVVGTKHLFLEDWEALGDATRHLKAKLREKVF